MNRKKIAILIIMLLVAAALLLRGNEDTWICENGQWLKHGNPSAPMPAQPCGEKPVVCAMDAKLCPDGSHVSRIPPKCDFALCPETKKVKLYYYNPESDKDEFGNIKCSRDGLTAIEREVAISKTPIQNTIDLLLKGKENLTEEEIERGIATEYPLEGFSLKGASLEDGVLTLEFDDPKSKTIGGSCRVGILWFQIEATAKQFIEIRQVRFLPEEIFQP